MGVIVLAPTRSRPERASMMAESFLDTKLNDSTQLVLVVDETDVRSRDYRPLGHFKGVKVIHLWGEETGNLVRATNTAAKRYWSVDTILGHVGDDHLFRTPGWDEAVEVALIEPGIAYGDDLLQHERLPTAAFMSSVIPRTLGWMALPSARHLYIDDAWKKIGEELGRLHYLPEVVIEHMHPAAGKAESDAGYEKWNSEEAVMHDRAAFHSWQLGPMREDMKRLKEVMR